MIRHGSTNATSVVINPLARCGNHATVKAGRLDMPWLYSPQASKDVSVGRLIVCVCSVRHAVWLRFFNVIIAVAVSGASFIASRELWLY